MLQQVGGPWLEGLERFGVPLLMAFWLKTGHNFITSLCLTALNRRADLPPLVLFTPSFTVKAWEDFFNVLYRHKCNVYYFFFCSVYFPIFQVEFYFIIRSVLDVIAWYFTALVFAPKVFGWSKFCMRQAFFYLCAIYHTCWSSCLIRCINDVL